VYRHTSSDIVRSASERLHSLEFILGEIALGLELHSELQDILWELARLGRRVGLRDLLSRHQDIE
jgi:hypothetical protein